MVKKLKKVAGKIVSKCYNVFVEQTQTLDVVLITNKAIDSMLKSNACGVMCKLDIEKAYD